MVTKIEAYPDIAIPPGEFLLGAWVTSNIRKFSCQYYFVFKEVFSFYKVELLSEV